jgi:hypothetical protein
MLSAMIESLVIEPALTARQQRPDHLLQSRVAPVGACLQELFQCL